MHSSVSNKNYYNIFDVPRDTSVKDNHQAYRRQERALHPDKSKTTPK